MEILRIVDFLTSILCGFLGSGVGGTIVYLAVTKIIDDRIDKKQEIVWKSINELKKDCQSQAVCKVKHESVEKDNNRVEESLRRIEGKIDAISLRREN
jgi:hypothetical protein